MLAPATKICEWVADVVLGYDNGYVNPAKWGKDKKRFVCGLPIQQDERYWNAMAWKMGKDLVRLYKEWDKFRTSRFGCVGVPPKPPKEFRRALKEYNAIQKEG